eukprot:TRINITY_DN18893_c0_g1_i2.p5 TRINITY_DN18893_c0_g1~~TRINITY_DN18893_c0_g1_i2.p5  ORF type:complete len:219 (-),score=-12.83 TRINITY_DN18893_c0_g1_i2:46-702(-)
MLHPGGFFQDVRDGRFFQFGETVIVATIIVAILATLGAATIQGLRLDYAFDVALTAITEHPILKTWINRIVWDPISSIAFLFVVIIAIGVIFAGMLASVSLFTRRKISIVRALSYLTWSLSNHLLLIPLTLFLVSTLVTESIPIGWLVVCILFLIWGVFRLATALLVAFRDTARLASVLFTHVLCVDTVSYTHLTLPTICSVQISVVAVSLKKKNNKN